MDFCSCKDMQEYEERESENHMKTLQNIGKELQLMKRKGKGIIDQIQPAYRQDMTGSSNLW